MAAAGFFGKVSSHGDFVTRRLTANFVQECDRWLQLGMLASRERLGVDWLETYLNSPIWRFAFSGGVLDQQAWGGVLMPSVDRVGRHFPLLLAAASEGGAISLQWPLREKAWFDVLEDLALSSLGTDFQLDAFDAALCQHAPLVVEQGWPEAGGGPNCAADAALALAPTGAFRFPIPGIDSAQLAGTLPDIADMLGRHWLAGHSLWWTDGSPLVEGTLLVCEGLPQPRQFIAMLNGGWGACGWRQPGAAAAATETIDPVAELLRQDTPAAPR